MLQNLKEKALAYQRAGIMDFPVSPADVIELFDVISSADQLATHMKDLREAHGFDSWSAVLVELDKLRAELATERLRADTAVGDANDAERKADRYRFARHFSTSESFQQAMEPLLTWMDVGTFEDPTTHDEFDQLVGLIMTTAITGGLWPLKSGGAQ